VSAVHKGGRGKIRKGGKIVKGGKMRVVDEGGRGQLRQFLVKKGSRKTKNEKSRRHEGGEVRRRKQGSYFGRKERDPTSSFP